MFSNYPFVYTYVHVSTCAKYEVDSTLLLNALIIHKSYINYKQVPTVFKNGT